MAQGFLHWSNNFDEVQDFEGQIRSLAGGNGLMTDLQFSTGTRSLPLGTAKAGVSADLDALAAYVASLDTFASSPLRNPDGSRERRCHRGGVVRRPELRVLPRGHCFHWQRREQPAEHRYAEAG